MRLINADDLKKAINYLYIGTPEEIKSIEDFCRENISTELVMKSDTERE